MTMFPPESPCPKCGTDLSLSADAVKTSPEVGEMVERLTNWPASLDGRDMLDAGTVAGMMTSASALMIALDAERARLREALMQARAAFQGIQRATLEGRVCDDVAWFSEIETLHDYCASEIEIIDKSIARSALPASDEGTNNE